MTIGTPVVLGNAGGTADPLVITTSATANVNDTIIVVISGSTGNTVSSVTDSAGNTYVADKTQTGTNQNAFVYRATVTTQLPSGGTITISKGAALATGASAIAVSGCATVSPLDATGSANGNSTTPSASASTTNANDIVIGMTAYQTFTLTQPGGAWNALTGNTSQSSGKVDWAYQIVSVTGTYTYNPTLDLAAGWADIVVSYKAAAGGGSPELMLLGVGH